MSKNILYIGNKLSQQDRSVSTIETLGKSLEGEGYQLQFASSKKNLVLRMLAMCWALFRLRNWADMVLIDTYSTTAFWFAYVVGGLSKIVKLKYICILHGGNLPSRLQKQPRLTKQLFGGAYINVAPSMYLLDAFQQKGFKNLRYIPNSIEVANYTFKQRCEIQPKLLYVRAFAHIYNPMLALRTLKLLIEDNPDAELSMVGPFKDNTIEKCKAYAAAHQLPVKFTGKMEKEEWIAYAKDFDIFINTTNVDNTPVSLIEAMALGLPIVTTNVGGIPYLVEQDQALLVPPNQPEEMNKAIKKLLGSPKLVETLSFNGRKKAERYDWKNIKNQWLELLG